MNKIDIKEIPLSTLIIVGILFAIGDAAMKENKLVELSMKFAVDVINLVNHPRTDASLIKKKTNKPARVNFLRS